MCGTTRLAKPRQEVVHFPTEGLVVVLPSFSVPDLERVIQIGLSSLKQDSIDEPVSTGDVDNH
ncbi:MAG: hypothetical protein GY861_21265 [bacterium]|nr:hypothetical protein [bacterium]